MQTPGNPSHQPAHVLILGGTREARLLAEALARQALKVTYALHRPTGTVPAPAGCGLHLGSFGGADGLAAFLRESGVTVFVNALHPHAETMQQRARTIGTMAGLPCFRLERPLWQPNPDDRWQPFDSADALNQAVRAAAHRRLFLSVGPQSLPLFQDLGRDATLIARRFDQQRGAALPGLTWIDGQPNPSLDDEIALLDGLGVDALVSKNSGGQRPTKLDAAARLGLPVYLLRPAVLEDEPGGQAFTDWQTMRDAILAATNAATTAAT